MERFEVIASRADLKLQPMTQARLDSEVLRGEIVQVSAESDAGWLKVKLETDGQEGFMRRTALAALQPAPFTHRIAVPSAHLFPAADIKAPPLGTITMGALVRVVAHQDRFAVTERGEYLIADHLVALERRFDDFVTTAETLLHAPYLWGGKSVQGIDCSGLVQLALAMAGMASPRDSGPQAKALGRLLNADETPRRGDLLFWPGHVAICADAYRLIHANGHHMLVVYEDRVAAIARIAATGLPAPLIKRL